MIDVLQDIAMLCGVHSGMSDIKSIEKAQMECHRYYVNCISQKREFGAADDLKKCMGERK